MIVLGIDPGLNITGWGVISCRGEISRINSGIIRSSSRDTVSDKLYGIYCSIEEVISEYKPDKVVIENIFINMNPASSIKLCYARGVVMMLVGKYKIGLIEVSPTKVKKTVQGAGRATKMEVKYMLQFLVHGGENAQYVDEADALAIAYAGYTLAS